MNIQNILNAVKKRKRKKLIEMIERLNLVCEKNICKNLPLGVYYVLM